jgi:hypothetical protein
MKNILLAYYLVINLLLVPKAEADDIVKIGGIFDLSSPVGSIWGNDERDGFILVVENFQKLNSSINSYLGLSGELSFAGGQTVTTRTYTLEEIQ